MHIHHLSDEYLLKLISELGYPNPNNLIHNRQNLYFLRLSHRFRQISLNHMPRLEVMGNTSINVMTE